MKSSLKNLNFVDPGFGDKVGNMPKAPDPAHDEAVVRRAPLFTALDDNAAATLKAAMTTVKIMEEFGGRVPRNIQDLTRLPGVGRKTANVVLGYAFDIPGITVDTHFGRLSRRFGWTHEKNPEKVECEVGELIPRNEWTNLSQRMIWHGRQICHSRKPACGACPLAKLCPSYGIGEMDPAKAKKMVKSEEGFR